MTRLWTDGFEFRDLYGYCYGTGAYTRTDQKRSGNSSAFINNTGPTSEGWFRFSVDAIDEFYLRFGVYVLTTKDWPFIRWKSGDTTVGYIGFSGCNVITAYTTVGGSVGAGATSLFEITWYLIEAHVKIDAAAGVIEVKLDGKTTLEIDFTGNTGAGTVDTIEFFMGYGGLGEAQNAWFDDIALNDTAGGVDDSWPGEGKIIVMMPNDDSAPLELTPSAAVDHHLLVDEVPSDDDVTYVEGSVVDEEDMYKLTPSGLVDVDINRVWTEARTRKTTAIDGKVALITKAAGGAEVSGGDRELLTTYSLKILGAEELENPVDSNPWEVADIDLIEIGPRTR